MTDISLVDVGVQWFQDIVDKGIEWFQDGLISGYESVTESIFSTPTPQTGEPFGFGVPTNEPWKTIYGDLVGGEIMIVALLLLITCVQGRNTIRIFNIGSTYEARKARKTAWTGGILIVAWYWVAAVSVYFVDAFTLVLIPSVGTVAGAMVDLLTSSVENPALALSLNILGGSAMWALQSLFFLRDVLLIVFIYGMPIGIALAYGNLPVVSRIASRVCLKFVPLLVMPIPVALLFHGYELLFGSGTVPAVTPDSAFLSHLVAVSLPVVSVVLVWKTFSYATPRLTRTVETAAGAALTAGAVVGAGAAAGPWAASTAARWGPRAAAGHVIANRVANGGGEDGDTFQSALVTDGDRLPAYRRTGNEPGGTQ
ncbi:hypothetical protein GCM10027435_02980 [Haloparvum alkalitolerans]|uniref:hypothetical protein n=1 Tax=Haloparvum alkalitolerans TaxID=1042953 RepID=UPI003CF330BA